MKKVLLFGSGFVAGILATILTAFLISIANKPNDGIPGLTIFPEEGECLELGSEIEVFQVLAPNAALARNSNILDGLTVVLLINYDGKTYYDNQKIKIPANECAKQIGTYQYTTRQDNFEKTVPAVVIDINTDYSENEINVQKQVQYVEVKGKKGNVTLYIGMSKDSVQVLAGKPDEVRMNTIGGPTYEEWGYKINNKYVSDLTIDFKDGKLEGVSQD